MPLPIASIVIVTFNGRELLSPCLAATLPQTDEAGAEVIVVDNGSSDGTVPYLTAQYPQVRLVASERNLGFAGGCNLGTQHAGADRIVLLNNDAVPAPGWLDGLLGALEEPGVALACSVVHEEGFAEAYALGTGSLSVIGHPVPGANEPDGPFYATGASLIFRRSLLGEPFDPDYFAYYEDVLLSWRARLEGYRVVRALSSHVWHLGSATASRNRPLATYYYERNKLLTLLVAFEACTLGRLFPLYLFDGLTRAFEDVWQLLRKTDQRAEGLRWTVRRYGLVLRGVTWIAGHLPSVRAKRRSLQRRRTILDTELIGLLSGKIFDDVTPSRLHRAANFLSVAYCRLVGVRTAEHSRGQRASLTGSEGRRPDQQSRQS